MKILNLTRGSLTPEQELAGAADLRDEEERSRIRDLAAFAEPPGRHVLLWRAAETVRLLRDWGYLPVVAAALIGGPRYFAPYLAAALRRERVTPLCAFRPPAGAETGDANPARKAVFVEWPSQYDVSFFRN